MTARRPLLAASLIVRDAEQTLVDCLASLGGVVDEIVVHDTGSLDTTREIARRAGAVVIDGTWADDFSAARNIALDAVRAQWVLSLDADERLVADPHLLRRLLLETVLDDAPLEAVGAFLLSIVHLDPNGKEQTRQRSTWLFRRDGARWRGRVHEVVDLPSGALARYPLPERAAFVEHRGYTDPATIAAKAERNLLLVEAELRDLLAAGIETGGDVCRVLYDLARSFLGVDRRQEAVEALATLCRLAEGDLYGALAAALLAQTLLDAGGFADLALDLEAQLRGSGFVDPRQARWIRAQALCELGRGAEAAPLLDGLEGMHDPAGIPLATLPVRRLRESLGAARA